MSAILADIEALHGYSCETRPEEESGIPKYDAFPLIPEGIYQVQYVRHDGPVVTGPPRKVGQAPEKRIFVWWEIVECGEYLGVSLFQSYKFYPRYGIGSKFYTNWVIANSGIRPRARTRMNPNIFRGKIFKACVSKTSSKYESGSLKGKPKPDCVQYSVVSELMELLTSKAETSHELKAERFE